MKLRVSNGARYQGIGSTKGAEERVKELESAVRSLQTQNERLRLELAEQKKKSDSLTRQAFHDRLTGLKSRAYLVDAINRSLHKATNRPPYCGALLFLDLDGFKTVNDSLGHGAGDAVLVEAARRLGQSCRPQDVVCRLGGDEFVVLLDDMQNFEQASAVAERILHRFAGPIEVQGRRVTIGVSIGGCELRPRHTSAEDVLHDGDVAMYRAKRMGGHRYMALHDLQEVNAGISQAS